MSIFDALKKDKERDRERYREQNPERYSEESSGASREQGSEGYRGLNVNGRLYQERERGKGEGVSFSQSGERFLSEDSGGEVSKIENLTVNEETIRRANKILFDYKRGKTTLESRIVENEKWWKLRHWETMRKAEEDIAPASAWLFNCLAAKHADAMDNYPDVNCLPREESDRAEAESLSDILPVILEQNDFEKTYSEVWWYKLKTGCGVYGVFWDSNKLNGLGDIEINKVDLLNLFWEPGVTDIQDSPNLFLVTLVNNDELLRKYPSLGSSLSSPTVDIAKYAYDDTVDTSDKSAVVDWYYKVDGVLHYVKYCNMTVLFATENEIEPLTDAEGNVISLPMAQTGLYDHGKYPFIFDVLFSEEGTPAGFGYIDICKEPQKYIDYMNQAFLTNTLMQSRPRYFVRSDGGINEKEFLDWRKSIVHTNAGVLSDDIYPIATPGLSGAAIQMLENKIDELKETSGNRDVSNGGTSGATAASAIAAMQEAGSKLSRDMIKSSYRAFRDINLLCIELIRQFYNIERSFRITGKNNETAFVHYKNSGLLPRPQGAFGGVDMGMRLPIFDVKVSAQKASPYSKMAQNELALQFYQSGIFNPQLADQALLTLSMMDFEGKDDIMNKVSQNGTLLRQVMAMRDQIAQMAAIIDSNGGDLGARILAGAASAGTAAMGGFGSENASGGAKKESGSKSGVGGGNDIGESSITENARKKTAEMTTPN